MEMEISELTKKKTQNIFSILKSLITWFGLFLIIFIFLYSLYLIEKFFLYVIYSIIYNILDFFIGKIISYKIIALNNNIFWLSIVLLILIHIKFFQIIILSFTFLAGGIFSSFFCDDFKEIINKQIDSSQKLENCLYFSMNQNMLKYYNRLLIFQKAFNNQKKYENKTFEIKQYQFSEILNNIIILFQKYREKNYQDENLKNNIMNQLKVYQKAISPYKNASFIDKIIKFNNTNSMLFMKELLINSFENRVCNVINISYGFDIYIIYPEQNGNENNNQNNSNIKTLVIYCGQNASIAEMFSINKNNIKFFLGIKEYTIILWNYKGYGSRKGFPSFSNIDKDVEDLKNYIIKNYAEYKIIIHGISIGGYPAIKLAKILNEYNDKYKSNVCLIADRTYSDIDLIVESFNVNYGYILKKIYNFLFPKYFYHSDNIQNYIDVHLENKFIFFDEEDKKIIYNKSSLVYNLTIKYYKEIVLPKISKYKQYNKLNNMTKKEFDEIKLNMKRIKNSINDDNFRIIFKNMNIIDKEKFLIFFLVFGYPFNINKEIFYEKKLFVKTYIEIPLILRNIYELNKICFNTILFDFFSDLNFLFIKSNLTIPFNDKEIMSFKYNNDNKEFILQEDVNGSLLKYFGFVHRIFCDHNGTWNNNDELYLKKFLELKGFINLN